MKYLSYIAITLSLFSVGYTYQTSQSSSRLLGVAQINTTATTDTLETFRTNVNASLTNLKNDAVATSTGYSWASLQQFLFASSTFLSSANAKFGGSATTTITAGGLIGIASTSPLGKLGIGAANSTSTISGGYFCSYFRDETGKGMWIKLDPTGATVFSTSTTPCN